ncbi:MAG TPA: hypothetical protein VF921_14580 [Vicinamibacterales bacterium]
MDLRPLTLAELLDRSFSTYKRHLWLFVGIMAVPAIFATLYAVVAQFFNRQIVPGLPPDQILRRMAPVFAGAMVFSVTYLMVYACALGATTIAVAHLYKEQAITVGAAYREVRRHGWRMVLLLLWGTLRVGGAWLGLVVLTGIVSAIAAFASPVASGLFFVLGMFGGAAICGYLAVRYGLAVPAVVLEDLSAGRALSRSVELTEGYRGRVFLIILCAMMISYASAALLQGPFMVGAFLAGPGTPTAVALTIVGAILGGIGGMFSGPIMIIGLAMEYYDLRIRKEALDLQMMLDSLDVPVK